jgi:hypothetical protein
MKSAQRHTDDPFCSVNGETWQRGHIVIHAFAVVCGICLLSVGLCKPSNEEFKDLFTRAK